MKRNLIYHTHIQVANDVSVCTPFNDELHATKLEAIARDGITLTCDRATLDQLLPNSFGVAPKQPVKMEVSFQLNGEKENITADCNVISVRRLSRDTFQLDMRFQEISECYFNQIDHYIENSLKQHRPQYQQVA